MPDEASSPPATHGLRHRPWWQTHGRLLAILALALSLRLALSARTIIFPADEMWQYIEPAWGQITGHWITTWEFHAGIRGWLIPTMLSPALWLGHALAPATPLHLYLLRGMLSLASLGVVAGFYDLGARISPRHATIAGLVGAVWVEILALAPRASSEGIAITLLVPAIALLTRINQGSDGPASVRAHKVWAVVAGLLLALGLIARFQYAPAITFAALWGPNRDQRRVLPSLFMGGVAGLGLGAAADLAAGHTPYAWVLANFTINLVQGISTAFGTEPPWWYLTTTLATWGWTSLLLLPAIVAGARRFPMPLAVALVVIANHSAMAHKEYRFVALAVVMLIFLAAIGSVDLAEGCGRWLGQRLRWPRRPGGVNIGLGAVWCAMSLTVGLAAPFNTYWNSGHRMLDVLITAGHRPDLCGLAIYRPGGRPTAAYSGLNRPVPILLFDDSDAKTALAANQQRFNSVITPGLAGRDLPDNFHLDQCMPDGNLSPSLLHYCIFTRPGACAGGSGAFDYNRLL